MFKGGSKKSFTLETIYDPKAPNNPPLAPDTNGVSRTGVEDDGEVDYSTLMETKADRRRRRFSLAVICFTSFTFTFSYSIILTSAKPYLDEMDPDAGTQFLGLFIAAQPLAQLFFSPLMGFLANKIGSIRYLSMTSTVILAGGFAFYACVSALPEPRRWYLFASRFIIGAAGGANTLSFSYIASATTVKERTTAVSLNALAAAAALVIGPVVQASFSPLGTGQSHPMGGGLYFNVFTAPSWLAVIMSLINGLCFTPCIFKEYSIAKEEGVFLAARNLRLKNEEAAKKGEAPVSQAQELRKPDRISLVVCIIIFASVQFNFIFLESLTTLLAMEQLGWTEQEAIVRVGITFAAAGLYIAVLYIIIGPLSRRLGERITLMIGLLFLIAGPIALYPYGGPPPPFECPPVENITEPITTVATVVGEEVFNWVGRLTDADYIGCLNGTGCPVFEQAWCESIPALHIEQMLVGFILIVTGYPLASSMSNATFSKIIGPHPQGTYMGILAAGACLARILCPLCVTSIYAKTGTWATFGFMTGLMGLILAMFFIFFRKLVPYQYEDSVEANRH